MRRIIAALLIALTCTIGLGATARCRRGGSGSGERLRGADQRAPGLGGTSPGSDCTRSSPPRPRAGRSTWPPPAVSATRTCPMASPWAGASSARTSDAGRASRRSTERCVGSAPHYANMVDAQFHWVGVGVAYGGGQMYVAEVFMDGDPPPAPAYTGPQWSGWDGLGGSIALRAGVGVVGARIGSTCSRPRTADPWPTSGVDGRSWSPGWENLGGPAGGFVGAPTAVVVGPEPHRRLRHRQRRRVAAQVVGRQRAGAAGRTSAVDSPRRRPWRRGARTDSTCSPGIRRCARPQVPGTAGGRAGSRSAAASSATPRRSRGARAARRVRPWDRQPALPPLVRGGWSGWESLGGVLSASPTAASWGPGRIDVFVRGTDNALYHRWYAGAAWSGLGVARRRAHDRARCGVVGTRAASTSSSAAPTGGMWHRWWT